MSTTRSVIFDADPIPYRGAVESSDLNRLFNQLRDNTLQAFLRSLRVRDRAHELTLATVYGNVLQTAYQEALRRQIDALRASGSARTLHVSFYRPTDTGLPPDVGIRRDRLYGQISLAEQATWSKIPTYVDAFGDQRAVNSVTISQDGTALDHKHPLYWVLNGTADRFWIDNTAGVDQDTILRITMPPGIRGEVNSLSVVPFPTGACLVRTLDYRSTNGYVQVPGFTESSLPQRTHFFPGSFSDEIRLFLRASAVTIGDDLHGIFGLAHVSASLCDYVSSGTAYAKLTANGSDTFREIAAVSADYFLDSTIPIARYQDAPVEFSIVSTTGTSLYNSRSNIFPLTTAHPPIAVSGAPTELWLKVDLREPVDRVTPVVRSVTVTYN